MTREEGSSVAEVTLSLESGVAGDVNHGHQLAAGVAQASGWVLQGAAVATPTAGGLLLQGTAMSFTVQGTEL